jgi:hypothetical protein
MFDATGASSRRTDDTRVTRGGLPRKVAGVLLPLALVLGGGVSAFGLTIEGAGVFGNGLMLSLFGASKTPGVTIVAPSSLAPALANEIPSNTSSGVLPSPLQVLGTPPGADPMPDLSSPPNVAAANLEPPGVLVASANLIQLPGSAAPWSPGPIGATSAGLAGTTEAPEPATLVLMGTGLLVLAAKLRRCRWPHSALTAEPLDR